MSAPKAGLEKVPRGYAAAQASGDAGRGPAISAEPPAAPPVARATAEATLAIVGLNPAKTIEVPAPPASRAGGFFGGPAAARGRRRGRQPHRAAERPGTGGERRRQGHAADAGGELLADIAGESAGRGASLDAPAPESVRRSRVRRDAVAPDPRFAGRVVYSIAIQMPNVTSFSGSWLVWFAEREPLAWRGSAADASAGGGAKGGSEVHRGGGGGAGGGHGAAVRRDPQRRACRRDCAGAATGRPAGSQRAGGAGEVGVRTRRCATGLPVDVDAIFEIPFHLAPRLNQ